MTDKEQIMIDGVDVSGCLFYQSNFEEDYDVRIKHFCSNWHNSCESSNNSNCYFKQLAHKTQECEELKELTEVSSAKYQSLKMQYKNLVEINNKRKDEIKTLKYMLYEEKELSPKLFKANFKIAKLERDISSHKNRFKYELDRYRKAFEEIEKELKEDVYCESQECGCDDFEECLNCVKTQILDIINKAKGGE